MTSLNDIIQCDVPDEVLDDLLSQALPHHNPLNRDRVRAGLAEFLTSADPAKAEAVTRGLQRPVDAAAQRAARRAAERRLQVRATHKVR